jgi:hypothetical protein
MFLWTYVLARNIRYQQDLVDQHCNSSEKRLARVLLLLAHFDGHGATETTMPKMRHETLAEMVGSTRSRISFSCTGSRNPASSITRTKASYCEFIGRSLLSAANRNAEVEISSNPPS